ncbi:MAG: hypothetical protein J1F09_07465 [Oscillospiraceae bacterium]|nr:hypothetical protein [Oscillospiraceae bacterium]
MSEKKYKQSNQAPLIATIVVAAAAIAAVIVLLVMMSAKNKTPSNSVAPNGFRASAELIEECTDNAHDLVGQNYEILKLFVTEGLPHKDEPYGNKPEDGIYTVSSEKYTALSQIEELVKSVYVESEANRVLKNMEVTLEDGTKKNMAVYKTRTVFGETFLGIDEQFSPNADYKTDWSSCFVEVLPTSENSCDVTVYVNGISVEEASAHPESVLKTVMVKQEDGWRLVNMLL